MLDVCHKGNGFVILVHLKYALTYAFKTCLMYAIHDKSFIGLVYLKAELGVKRSTRFMRFPSAFKTCLLCAIIGNSFVISCILKRALYIGIWNMLDVCLETCSDCGLLLRFITCHIRIMMLWHIHVRFSRGRYSAYTSSECFFYVTLSR